MTTQIRASRPSINALQPSLIRKVANAAIGKTDVIPLWFGEPDKPTPQFIREAAKDAIDEGQTFYQPNLGIVQLREALATYTNGLYGTDLTLDNIAVTPSGMTALSVVLQCIVAEGDTVVIPSPVWPNLPSAARILGAEIGRVSLRPAAEKWQLDLDELFDACSANTRAMLINSPNNPTGWMLEDDEQQEILDFCRERDIWLIADEVYNRIVFDRSCAPSFIDKVTDEDKYLIINSFSKSWAMTGWRLGWITMPASLISAVEMVTEYNFSCIFSPTQIAGITALTQGEDFIRSSTARYRAALELLVDCLAELPRVSLPAPQAAFYAFFTVEGMGDSYSFALDVLRKTGVGLAPGAAFGPQGEGYLRLCFAVELDLLERALCQMRPLLI
ncbi:MAG: pyridoxal phosphate-dependent aminotransferase [Chloroflexi bacterium]|nr:pyridoxal phosphate-dependent aminotransferase [Chloroflexota bacterium]